MTTFVLVPGGWHGAWCYEAVVPLLERAGHTVHALTLTGLHPDDDEETVATANLDTHADDVLRVLDRARISNATLVGHSYAGLVIAAAADRADGRISRLVHFDAYVPSDGDSCWTLTSEAYRQAFVAGAAATGYSVQPPYRPGRPNGGDLRRRPHPIASLTQAIRLTGAAAKVPHREFVYCPGWEAGTPFRDLRDRLVADPGWRVHELPTAHNAMREAPDAVAQILLDERVDGSPEAAQSATGSAGTSSWPGALPADD
jgi:pimeloyl-ACP methyl ester carboxylesterase